MESMATSSYQSHHIHCTLVPDILMSPISKLSNSKAKGMAYSIPWHKYLCRTSLRPSDDHGDTQNDGWPGGHNAANITPPPLTSFPTLQLHSHIATADSMNNEVIGRALWVWQPTIPSHPPLQSIPHCCNATAQEIKKTSSVQEWFRAGHCTSLPYASQSQLHLYSQQQSLQPIHQQKWQKKLL